MDGEDEIGQVLGVLWKEQHFVKVLEDETVLEDIVDELHTLLDIVALLLDICLELSNNFLFLFLLWGLIENVVEKFLVLTFVSILIAVLGDVETVDQEVLYYQRGTVTFAGWQDQRQVRITRCASLWTSYVDVHLSRFAIDQAFQVWEIGEDEGGVFRHSGLGAAS